MQSFSLEGFYPPLPKSFEIQLYGLIGIYSLSLAFASLGIVARIKRRSLWFFRRDSGGRIIPNVASHITLWVFLFGILAIAGMFQLLRVYVHHGDQYDIVLWRQIVWLPILIASYFQTWGTLAASCPPHSRCNRYWNYLLFTIPVLGLGLIIAPLIFANYYFNEIWSYSKEIIGIVTTNPTLSPTLLQEIDQKIILIKSLATKSIQLTRISYSFFATCTLIIAVTFLYASFIVHRQLRNQIRLINSSSLALGISTPTRAAFVDINLSASSKDRKDSVTKSIHVEADEAELLEEKSLKLKVTSRQLLYHVAFAIAANLVYLSLMLFVIIDTADALSPANFMWDTLGPIYIWGFTGLPGLILVTIHSFKSGSFTGTTLRPPLVLPVVFEAEEDDFDLEELNEQLGVSPRTNRVDGANSVYQSDYSRSRNVSELDSRSVSGMSMKAPPSPLMDLPRDAFGRGSRERL